MFHFNSGCPSARLVRILALTSVFLVLGILWFVLPVFAASITIDQCGNGAESNPMSCYWTSGILGNSNSHYIEGMATPQRFLMQDLYGGSDGTQCDAATRQCNLTFSVSWSDVAVHGYDFIVSWEDAVKLAKNKAGVSDLILNPCSNYNNAQETACTSAYTNGSYIDIVVPDDPFQSGSYQVTSTAQSRIDAYEALWGNRTIRLYANDVITAATLTLQHCDANLSTCPIANGADTSGTTVISYTLVFTTNATNALLTFAAHLAESGNPRLNPLAWGYENGAGSTGGANWHVKDPKLNYTGGSQDNQISLYEQSVYPIDSGTRAGPEGTLTSGAVTDTIWITNTGGNNHIAGYVHYYLCRDTAPPYSPALSSSIPYGCLGTSDYTVGTDTVKVTDVGTRSVTFSKSGQNYLATGNSPIFTPTYAGRYCFLTIFYPTDTKPYNYGVMSDTNGSGECFYYNSPTAVRLSSLQAGDNTNWTLVGVTLGLLGILVSAGILKFGFDRD